MKKIIYLSIAFVTLSLTSCRNQDDMVQINDVKTSSASKSSAVNNNATNYGTFDSSSIAQGDPARPPKE
jgi:hypothetical protein